MRKNQVLAKDAEAIEAAFAARLAHLGETEQASGPQNQKSNGHRGQPKRSESGSKDVTIIGKPVRERDRDHLRFVAAQPCLVCGRTPSDPHHVKFAEQRMMGRKVSDRFTVPICRLHHRELHRRGNERAWWQTKGIDPLAVAAALWAKTHEVGIPGDRPSTFNWKLNDHFGSRDSAAGWTPNDETNPILNPEAE